MGIWAAEHDTSISRFVGELLKNRMIDERNYLRAYKRFKRRGPARLKESGTYPTRDQLHERDMFC